MMFRKSVLLSRIVLCLLLSASAPVLAQTDLFGDKQDPKRSGFMLGANGAFNMVAGDMADRFGAGYSAGPAVYYRTKSGWVFGAKFDFLFHGKVKEDSLLANVRDDENYFININGRREAIEVAGRGYTVGLQVGRLLPIARGKTANNVFVSAGTGFLQHKILINDKEGNIPQIKGDYRKGYDRLSNGMYAEAYAGFAHFSEAGFSNFHIGLSVLAGFTAGRRDYLFDVRQPGTASRTDILFGIRGGWFFPLYRRASEETFYE